jgi:hypothetical protein
MTSAFCDSRNEHHKAKGITSGPYETGSFQVLLKARPCGRLLSGKSVLPVLFENQTSSKRGSAETFAGSGDLRTSTPAIVVRDHRDVTLFEQIGLLPLPGGYAIYD